MAKKKKTKAQELAERFAQTRDRLWIIKPVTRVVPNKKAKLAKEACRSKVVD